MPVTDPNEFDWEDNTRPNVPWSKAIIYETHVKGFTRLNSGIPKELRRTFEGMGHKTSVDYLKSLGITSVELMPVHYFPDDKHLLDNGLRNFWGYNTLNFFSPASRYYGPKGIQCFRNMVRAYHDAGLEVILDVVYNTRPRAMSSAPPSPSRASTISPTTGRCQVSIAITSMTPVPGTPSILRIRACCTANHGFAALLDRIHACRRFPLRSWYDPGS